MTKQAFTQLEERAMRNRAQEIGFDLNFGYPTYSERQKKVIRSLLANKNVDLSVIEIVCKPDVPAGVMEEIVRGWRAGLSLDDVRFLMKLKEQPVKSVVTLFRKVLQNENVTGKLLRKIFTLDDDYRLYLEYKIGSDCYYSPMVDLSKKLEMILFFLQDGKTKEVFLNYIIDKRPTDIQFFLSLCSGLPELSRVVFLERELPLGAIYCYKNYNSGNKSLGEFVDYIKIHPRAQYYAKAFLNGKFDQVENEKLVRFFDVKSNWLTDELFVVYELEPSFLDKFTEYENIHRTYGSPNLPKYSGFEVDRTEEPAILAKSIVEWIGKGVSVDTIAAFVNSFSNLTDFALNVGLYYDMTLEDATKVVVRFKDFSSYYIHNVTKNIKEGYSLKEIFDRFRV